MVKHRYQCLIHGLQSQNHFERRLYKQYHCEAVLSVRVCVVFFFFFDNMTKRFKK